MDIWGPDTAFTDVVFEVGMQVGLGGWLARSVVGMVLGIWLGMGKGIELGMSDDEVGSVYGTVWNGDPSDTNGFPGFTTGKTSSDVGVKMG